MKRSNHSDSLNHESLIQSVLLLVVVHLNEFLAAIQVAVSGSQVQRVETFKTDEKETLA